MTHSHQTRITELIEEISNYEIEENKFRKSCCTAWDLCDHTVIMRVPQYIWLELKDLLLMHKKTDK